MEVIMSYPYPQDRHRDRKEKSEQPYKDAKEAMTEGAAQMQNEAEAFGEARQRESEEVRARRIQEESETALHEVSDELERSREDR
jgi:hypothetical protein